VCEVSARLEDALVGRNDGLICQRCEDVGYLRFGCRIS